MNETTIQLDKSVVLALQKSKDYPRQTYNEFIKKLLEVYKNLKIKNQYDEFLHKIQMTKMKEIWDNSEDEVWDNV